MSQTTISIVCTADEAYVPHLAAMLHSLFSAAPSRPVDFRFLHHADFDGDVMRKLEALCHVHGAMFTPTSVPRDRLGDLPTNVRYRQEAWYRLILPSLLPDLDRVLWLDADLLILHSIDELWAMDLGGKPLAAVPNALSPRDRGLPLKLNMADPNRYFNTGVMLMDLKRMRAIGTEEKLRKAATCYREHNLYADQDVFNPVFGDCYMPLPLPWNVTTGTYFYAREAIRVHGMRRYTEAIRRPKIVHYTQHKPWLHTSLHPYRDLYLRHRVAAGWSLPSHPKPNWKRKLVRRLPLTVYTLLSAPRRLSLRDLRTILCVWIARPYSFPQRNAGMAETANRLSTVRALSGSHVKNAD